jgi:hypothetical protein
MSQVPAVSCIQVPREETVEAIQRSRNRGMRSGANPEGVRVGGIASAADVVLGVSNGIVICFSLRGHPGGWIRLTINVCKFARVIALGQRQRRIQFDRKVLFLLFRKRLTEVVSGVRKLGATPSIKR